MPDANVRPWPIPVQAAREIAEDYGYDQVVIIGRKVGENGVDWHATYGRTKEHCRIADRMMRWLERMMTVFSNPVKRARVETLLESLNS